MQQLYCVLPPASDSYLSASTITTEDGNAFVEVVLSRQPSRHNRMATGTILRFKMPCRLDFAFDDAAGFAGFGGLSGRSSAFTITTGDGDAFVEVTLDLEGIGSLEGMVLMENRTGSKGLVHLHCEFQRIMTRVVH